MIFNYFTEEGKRTSIRFTETDVKAIKVIMKNKNKKDALSGYIKKKIWMSKARPRPQSFSAWLRECIMLDLLWRIKNG